MVAMNINAYFIQNKIMKMQSFIFYSLGRLYGERVNLVSKIKLLYATLLICFVLPCFLPVQNSSSEI